MQDSEDPGWMFSENHFRKILETQRWCLALPEEESEGRKHTQNNQIMQIIENGAILIICWPFQVFRKKIGHLGFGLFDMHSKMFTLQMGFLMQ